MGKRSEPRENARARGSLALSRETRFTCLNRRACSQARRPLLLLKINLNIANFLGLLIDKLENYQQHFPGQDDLEGAMAAINRLQDVYRLTPYDFTGGKYGIRSDSGSFLSAMDAYKFGRGAFGSEDMENTQRWMAESLRLMDMEPDNQKEKPNRFSVLDHLAWSSYQVVLSLG